MCRKILKNKETLFLAFHLKLVFNDRISSVKWCTSHCTLFIFSEISSQSSHQCDENKNLNIKNTYKIKIRKQHK